MAATTAYPRPVSRASSRVRRSARVYYIAALAISLSVLPGGADGQVDLTTPPSMVKGPPGAVVTIVEFADYQ